MAELDPIIQDVILNASEFIPAMDEVIHLLEEARNDTSQLDAVLAILDQALGEARSQAADLAAGFSAAAGSEEDLRNASAEADAAVTMLSNAVEGLRHYMDTGTVSADVYAAALGRDTRAAMEAAIAENALRDVTGRLALAQVAGTAAATTRSGGMIAQWLRQWNSVIHWVVMGSLEILATALPALTALTAGLVAMEPTFAAIKDQISAMITASGSFTNAIKNTAGPLHTLASTLGQVRTFASGNAFIILGSAIDVLARKTGLFSTMAKQASTVLADFATRIVTDLQGPAGTALTGFFTQGVKYMVQWGQVIGNIGHVFINVMNAMFGVGQLVLDVLNMLSRALVSISNNRLAATFIGVAAAMSAAYRWGKLLVNIWTFLGGTAAVNAIRMIAGEMIVAVAATGSWTAALTVLKMALITTFGPVLPILLGMVAVLGIWYLSTRNATDSTDKLIRAVDQLPPTVGNISRGIGMLSGNLQTLNRQFKSQAAAITQTEQHMGRFSFMTSVVSARTSQTADDINKTANAITKEYQKLIQLEAGLSTLNSTNAQVAAGMQVLGIQVGLQDTKVQQLTQAWDQYMSLVTGGTSTLGGLYEALRNIGNVTLISTRGLTSFNQAARLTTGQIAKQLTNFGKTGAQVWQQFDNIITNSLQPLADWMKTAQTAGAMTGPQFSQAILDMASTMIKFTANSKTAQAILLAFVQQAGLGIHTMPQLKAAIEKTGASQKNLTKLDQNATIAMSQLNQIAKNLSSTLTNQETQAIAAASLKASGFTQDLNNMLQAQKNNGTYGGRTTQQWAYLAQQAMDRASRSAQNTARQITAIKKAEDTLYSKTIQIHVNTKYTQIGAPGLGLPYGTVGTPAGGPNTGGRGGAGSNSVTVHVHGSVLTSQHLATAIQTGLNQKTIRNGSTQLFVTTRRH